MGGNVFKSIETHNTSGGIKKEYLQNTLRCCLKNLGLEGAVYSVVGNTNKDVLSDIDVAISLNSLKNLWNLNEYTLDRHDSEGWKKIKEKLEQNVGNTLNVCNRPLEQFHVLTKVIPDDSNSQPENGNEKKAYVQVDFFLGDENWMKRLLSGAPPESFYKAVYRNLVLESILHVIKVPTKKDGTLARLILNYRNGLMLVLYKEKPNKLGNLVEERLEEKVVLSNPNKLTKALFGRNLSWSDIDSFEKCLFLIYEVFTKEEQRVIFETLRKKLDKRKLSFPF